MTVRTFSCLSALCLLCWLLLPVRVHGLAPPPALTLEGAWQRALDHHPQVAIGRREVAKGRLLPAKADSLIKPQLTVNGQYSRIDEAITFTPRLGNVDLPPVETVPRDQSQASVELNQPLYRPTWLPRRHQAQHELQRRRHDFTALAQAVLLDITRTYLEAVRDRQLVTVGEDVLAHARRQVEIARARYEEGMVTEDAVLSAALQEMSAKTSLDNAGERFALSLANLERQLAWDRETDGPLRLTTPEPPAMPADDLEGLLAIARRERADYLAAQAAVAAARADLLAARHRYRPTADSGWNYYVVNNPAYNQASNYWIAFLRLDFALYDRGSRPVEIEERHQTLEQAQLAVRDLDRQMEEQLRAALSDLATARRQMASLEEQRQVAEKNYAIVLAKYELGAASPAELSQAATSRENVLRQRAAAAFQRDLALYRIQAGCGRFAAGIVAGLEAAP